MTPGSAVVEEEIPYGLRRAPLAITLFVAFGVGLFVWSRKVDGPTFVFPIGRVSAESASFYILVLALACFAYACSILYVRFLRRPRVRIGKKEVTIVLGEFGSRTQTLRRGEVRAVHDERTRGGWRVCRVEYEGGELLVQSARLPDDAAYERVRDALKSLIRE